MKRIILCWLLLLPCLLQAQTGIKGFVRNSKGEGLPYASIYVKNLQTGTLTNENGSFELRMPAGKYQLVFQELSSKTAEREVTVGEGISTLDITLEPQSFELREVKLSARREDPAYTIMRKAIAMSRIHKLQVDAYQARLYIKGSGVMKNVPGIIKKKLEKEGLKEGKVFLSETITDLAFEQPNKYTQKILSNRSSEVGNDGGGVSPMDFLQGSFYDPMVNGTISPLSPSAFAYYRFEWEASFRDQQYEVNKIKVIPRSKGEDVWEGYIYIVEDRWCIHSLQMKTIKFGFDVEMQQTHSPVEANVFMPIAHQMKIGGKFLGFGIDYNYQISVSDYQIKVNPTYNQEIKLIDEKIDKERAKEARQAQKDNAKKGVKDLEATLSNGGELTRKDLRKLLRNAEKAQLEAERQRTKKGETPPSELVRNDIVKVDSLAKKRGKDDAFWEKYRTIPLTDYEQKAYVERDSLAKTDSIKRATEVQDSTTKKKTKIRKFRVWDIALGGSYKAGKGANFSIAPLYEQLSYNTVEGVAGNLRLQYGRTRKQNAFYATGWLRYASTRELFTGKGELEWVQNKRFGYDTSKVRQVRWQLDGGQFIEQFNGDYAMHPWLNSLSTLFFERNFAKFYERTYTRLRWSNTLNEGLSAFASVEYARRDSLQNKSDWKAIEWKNREFTSNYPDVLAASEDGAFPHQAIILQGKLTYKPFLRYGMHNGRKYVISTHSPTFTLEYRRGLGDVGYNFASLGVQHNFKVGIRSQIGYAFSAGGFFDKKRMHFADYKHFNGNRFFIQFDDIVTSFRLLEYYRYSTNAQYAEGHAYIQFRKLALTQFTYLRMFNIKENVFVNGLITPQLNYGEVGYTLDGILRVLRIEGVASFENGRYRDWGIRVGLSAKLGSL